MASCPCGCRRRLSGDAMAHARRAAAIRARFPAIAALAAEQRAEPADVEVDLAAFIETGETLAWLLSEAAHGRRYVDDLVPFLADADEWERTAARFGELAGRRARRRAPAGG